MSGMSNQTGKLVLKKAGHTCRQISYAHKQETYSALIFTVNKLFFFLLDACVGEYVDLVKDTFFLQVFYPNGSKIM